MPFFSIIIPAYNRARQLPHSLQSVLSQTYQDFEVIIIDDGSTDNTREIVGAYNDARIRYIHQHNQERSASRNNGMKAAQGEYICFLDSDDAYLDNHLELLHQSINKLNHPVAIFKTGVKHLNDNSFNNHSFFYAGNDRNSAIKFVWDKGCQLNSVCIHKSIADAIKFPEEFFWFEDMYWAMNVVMRYSLYQVKEFTVTYASQDNSGLLNSNYKKYEENCVACIRDLESKQGRELKAILGNSCFDEKVAELYLGFIVANAIRNRQVKLGYSYLAKAVRTCRTPKLLIKYCYYSLKLLKASLVR